MVLIEDSRQQTNKHKNVHAYCERNGIEIVRTKMMVGDYTLPTNQSICIDTKQDMQEVYGNLVQSHERFRSECLLAMNCGIHLVILVEDSKVHSLKDVSNWRNPRAEHWQMVHNAQKNGKMLGIKISKTPPVNGVRLRKMMETMAELYKIEWQFCDKSQTGRRIMEILNGNG